MAPFSATSVSTTSSQTGNGEVSNDSTLANPPTDSISAVKWSPANDYLAVASWDQKLRIYDVSQNKTGVPAAAIDFEGPVLDCHWSKDGRTVIGAGADKTARILDLSQGVGSARQVAAHDAPIKSVRFVQTTKMAAPMVVTGSWDKSIKYWDHRASSSSPALSYVCQDKVYSMDTFDNLLVVATAERYVNCIALDAPTSVKKTITSPLAYQTRVVTCLDADTIAIGSVEGRLSVQYLKESTNDKNFSFKCHRGLPSSTIPSVTEAYPVNDVSLHPSGVFSTAGSDGSFSFWNHKARHRVKGFHPGKHSISATGFSRNGDMFAYAISYDWHKGFAYNTAEYPIKVMIHPVLEEEYQRKPVGSQR